MTAPLSNPDANEGATQHQGILVFLIITLGLAWLPIVLLRDAFPLPSVVPSRMLQASLVYALTMTLPPLVAIRIVRRWVDRSSVDYGVRVPKLRYHLVAVVGPFAIVALAIGIAELLAEGPTGSALATQAPAPVWLPFAYLGIYVLLWLQSASEELGWRGYLMERLVRQLGPWPGLLLHAALWGAWYAPHFLLAGDAGNALSRSSHFVVTSVLLGLLLGWLRIVSRSSLASTSANFVFTLVAGLPLTLYGVPSLTTSVFARPGWIALSLAILIVFVARGHRAVRTFPGETDERA